VSTRLHFGPNSDIIKAEIVKDIILAENLMNNIEKFVENLDELLENPKRLGNAAPKDWYEYLKSNGYEPKPLGKGNFEQVSFESGGGFRVIWDGDKMLQYHPAGRTHHGKEAYWKLSSGKSGTLRYTLAGDLSE